ncbi:hypothetical protein HMPREF3216_01045 [Gardnerella vaginalis]|uniref:Uncharacterized protein n=1 Tax=Gardnerella vaginalis TaxID=2702 RepID=A0A133NN07_GARVA|nr:hypothetical protein HMPREF3216_01045 [Gardnerella vaginalis]
MSERFFRILYQIRPKTRTKHGKSKASLGKNQTRLMSIYAVSTSKANQLSVKH